MNESSYLVATGLASILTLFYAVFVEGQLFFGLVAVSVLCGVSILLRRGEREHAAVVGALGLVVSVAFLLARLDVILVALVVAGLTYAGWSARRGDPAT